VTTESQIELASDIGDGITQIRLPMRGNPLRYINGYLLADDEGWMLVDCGWRAPDVEAALRDALAARGLAFADLRRVLITHHHFDHYGLAGTLRRAGVAELHLHRLDWERAQYFAVDRAEREARSTAWLAQNGYVAPADDAGDDFVANRAELTAPTHLLDDGVRVGRLTAIWTPGHAPGHVCFVDARSGRVLTGDHVLDPITPHVGIWFDRSADPLGAYLDSLEKIAAYGAAGALPAHGEPFADVGRRARAIIAHTHERDTVMLAALAGGPRSAGDVARAVPWTRRERAFATLSGFHAEFAVTETIAHLAHLAARGFLVRHGTDPILYARS
jgi:glyoxylase-like metal-dependent hydrolase (beta-lactamase superfamily II)